MPAPRKWTCETCNAVFSRAERRDYHKRETGHARFKVDERPRLTYEEMRDVRQAPPSA